MAIKYILIIVIQWTWGIIQNIIGLIIFLANINNNHYFYKGAVITIWNSKRGSMGIGMFIFISKECYEKREQPSGADNFERIKIHEYGHTIQSLILGPFFLFVITIPSALWALLPFFKNRRMQRGTSYYSAFTERWADALGSYIFYHK